MEITLGLQPTYADRYADASPLRELVNHDLFSNTRAIGEIGLDFHWVRDDNLQEKQRLMFIDCIHLANACALGNIAAAAVVKCLNLSAI